MLPPVAPGSIGPSANAHSELVGHAIASLELVPVGPVQVLHVTGETTVALTAVEYSAFPVLSATTQSDANGTHETAFTLLPESIFCV